MSSRCPLAVRTAFVLMGVWLAAYELHALLALPGTVVFGRFAHCLVLFAAVACCALRVLRVPRERLAWSLIAGAMLCWSIGDLFLTARYWHAPVPIPSPADAGFLAVYPLAFAGLAMLLRQRAGAVGATVWIDGLIAALVLAAYAAAVVVDQIVHSVGGTPASVATNLAYPLGDTLLMGLVIAGFAVARWHPDRGWWLLGAAILLLWIGDSVYLIADAQNAYSSGGLLDVLAWCVFVLLALAAWQEPAVERTDSQRAESLTTITVPVAFALLGLALLLAGTLRPIDAVAAILAAVSLVAVLLRLAITFREKLQLLGDSREQALTDPLTGLGNRRSLLADVGERCAAGAPRFQLALFDLDGFKDYNDRFGHPAGDVLLAEAARRLAAAVAPYGSAYRMGGDEFCAVVSCDHRELDRVIDAARSSLESYGDGFSIRSSSGVARVPADGRAASDILRVADARLYDEKRRRGEQPREQAAGALLQLIREFDPLQVERGRRIARLARAVAAELHLPLPDVEDVARAAELAPLGCLCPPPLGEAGGEDAARSLAAARTIAAAPSLVPVARIVRASSERFDGTGAPYGLTGAAIPRGSQVLAVCTAFDDGTAAGGAPGSVLEGLRNAASTDYDPLVVRALDSAFAAIAGTAPQTAAGGVPAPA